MTCTEMIEHLGSFPGDAELVISYYFLPAGNREEGVQLHRVKTPIRAEDLDPMEWGEDNEPDTAARDKYVADNNLQGTVLIDVLEG